MKNIAIITAAVLSACVAQPALAQADPVFIMCQQRSMFAESVMRLRHTANDISVSMRVITTNDPHARKDMEKIVNDAYAYPFEGNRINAIRSAAEFGVLNRADCMRNWKKIVGVE